MALDFEDILLDKIAERLLKKRQRRRNVLAPQEFLAVSDVLPALASIGAYDDAKRVGGVAFFLFENIAPGDWPMLADLAGVEIEPRTAPRAKMSYILAGDVIISGPPREIGEVWRELSHRER